MQYDETFAQELVERYELAKSTLRVWKTRGKIPDRYRVEYEKRIPPGSEDQEMERRIVEILSAKHWNAAEVFFTLHIPYYLYSETRIGRVSLSRQNILRLKKWAKKMAKKPFQTDDQLKRFLKMDTLRVFPLCEDGKQYNRVVAWLGNKRNKLPESDAKAIREKIRGICNAMSL
ncbi:MAG: hypothetical protein SF052_15755 [Bacteroidia bacterium]|nr:hypothetical protein [Bacteroidia bacterium]